MAVSQWDDITRGLFELPWTPDLIGKSVDVVVHIVCVGTDSSLAKLVASGSPRRLLGIPPAHCSSAYLTVFGAQIMEVPGVRVDLHITPETKFRAHPSATLDSLLRVVEFCSGLGASLIGLAKAGFLPVCGVEWQPALADLFSTLHPSIPVGDICATEPAD